MAFSTQTNDDLSLRDIFDTFTIGDENHLTLPVYISNYLFDVVATFYPYLAIFMFIVGSYMVIKSGSFKQGMKEQAISVFTILIALYLILSIPGFNQYKNKNTYFIVDIYASVISLGEDLADSLAYNILYGDDRFNSDNKPTTASKMDGFLESQKVIDKILAGDKTSAKDKRDMIANYQSKIVDTGLKELNKPLNKNSFIDMAMSFYVVGKDSKTIGYKEKILDVSKIKTIDSSALNTSFILYGSDLGDSDTWRQREMRDDISIKSYIELSGFSSSVHSKLFKPIYEYYSDISEGYTKILSGIVGNLSNYRSKAKEPKEIDKMIKAVTFMSDTMSALTGINKSGDLATFLNLKAKLDPNKMGDYYGMAKTFYDNIATDNIPNELYGLYNLRNDRSKNVSVEQLNNIIKKYRDVIRHTMLVSRHLVTAVQSTDSSILNIAFKNTFRVIEFTTTKQYKDNATYTYNSLKSMFTQAINIVNRESKNMYSDITGIAYNTKKELTSLAQIGEGKNNSGYARKISWVDLGFYYSFLKSHYTENVIMSTYTAAQGLYDLDAKLSAEELKLKLDNIKDTTAYANKNTDSEKIEKLTEVTAKSMAVIGALKGIKFGFNATTGKVGKKKDGLWTKAKNVLKAAKGTVMSAATIIGSGVISGGLFYIMGAIIAQTVLGLIYIVMPAVFWMLAFLSWSVKTAVIIALIPMNIFLLVFRSKTQAVISSFFNLVGQAMVPVVMVAIFFIVMTFAIQLDVVFDKFIPLLSSSNALTGFSTDIGFIDNTFDYLFNQAIWFIKVIILLIINTQLYMQFFKADEYVSEVIGERISTGGNINAGEVMGKMKMNQV
jgi:hypothetical protein